MATSLAAILAAIAFWVLRERGESGQEPAIAAAGMEARGIEAAAPPRATAPVTSSASATARIAAPVFDEIRVEKEEVCEGEENLVTVRAHTTDGNDPFLHYTVAGEAGAQVPVRSFLGRDGKPMPQMAVAFSRDNVATSIELPSWRVKNCRPARILIVTARMLPNSVAEREFSATVQTLEGPQFQPAWYEWSFGDGAQDTTPTALASHDYAGLPQKAAFTDVLVKVRALDGSGESVEGRLALQIRNVGFAARARGLAVIFAQPTPRFPQVGADGIVRQKFRIWHGEDAPIEITGLTVTRSFLPDAPGTPPAAPATVALDHGRVLRFTEIPPGRPVEQVLEHDFRADPRVHAVTYAIQGRTAAGLQARGELTLLRPPPQPTAENSIPIEDPEMATRIRRAMAILNQASVSQEDLWRLEREGKLQAAP